MPIVYHKINSLFRMCKNCCEILPIYMFRRNGDGFQRECLKCLHPKYSAYSKKYYEIKIKPLPKKPQPKKPRKTRKKKENPKGNYSQLSINERQAYNKKFYQKNKQSYKDYYQKNKTKILQNAKEMRALAKQALINNPSSNHFQ